MAKNAIKSLVDKLEPEDSFHLIQYDDVSDVVFTEGKIWEVFFQEFSPLIFL